MQANSCSTTGQCSTSSCGPQDNCSGGSCSQSSCEGGSCSCEGGMLCSLMCIAACAKKELMKDKLKAHLEAKIGKKMDQTAEIVTDLYLEKMGNMMECCEQKSEAEEKIMKIFKS